MLRDALILLIFLILSVEASTQTVVIRGYNAEYAGLSLIFNVYANQISNSEKEIGRCTVDASGNFEARFELSNVHYVFCHLGVFHGYLYAEPGNSYDIKLPRRIDKKPEDKLNPFFEEVKLHFILNSILSDNKDLKKTEELNFHIRTFDDYFDPYYAKYAMNVYSRQAVANMDSMLRVIDSTFINVRHPYFRDYYTYRIGLLKFMSTQFKSRSISNSLFLDKPVLYDNMAYMELFNKVYDKYLVYFGRTPEGKAVFADINSKHSLSSLKQTLGTDKVLSNDTLKELVILNSLHDGFYEMDFSRSGMLEILDSLIATTLVKFHKEIALEIRDKVTRLMVGNTPPAFRLLNQDSVWVSSNDLKGKNIYLIFCTTQNYACLKDFAMVKKWHEKHGKYFDVVCISADDSFENMRHYAKTSGYKFTFLYYGDQAEILRFYDIRTFPSYYFLDKDGKLGMSPAPGPDENFEMTLYGFLKSRGIIKTN